MSFPRGRRGRGGGRRTSERPLRTISSASFNGGVIIKPNDKSSESSVAIAARQASMFFNGALMIANSRDVFEPDMSASELPELLTGLQIPANVNVILFDEDGFYKRFEAPERYARTVHLIFRVNRNDIRFEEATLRDLNAVAATTDTNAKRVLFVDDGESLNTMVRDTWLRDVLRGDTDM